MKKLRVLLINPICAPNISNFVKEAKRRKINADEPLGLAHISAWIKKKLPQVKVEVYDHHIDSLKYAYKDKTIGKRKVLVLLKKKISQYKPNIVGIGASYHMNADVGHETAAIVKNINKDIVVVLGGIYPTASPGEVLKDKNIDFVIPGEGEISFEHFLEFQLGKKKLNDLTSIGYRVAGSKKIYFSKRDSFIKDLNELDFPDRSTLPIGKYSIWGRTFVDRYYKKNALVAAIQPSRGCPFRCTFCCSHLITSRNYRMRNVKNVVKEMKYLKDKYGIEVFAFNDENASVNARWNVDLYNEMIKAKLGTKWIHSGGFYVDLMTDELIQKAIESGLIMFNLAIESGSLITLKRVKKAVRIIKKAPKVVKKIRRYDPKMCIAGFFLCGFPFETYKQVEKTINFAKSLDLDWARFNLFQPFPGCELYSYCIDKGHLPKKGFTRKNLLFYLSSQLKNMLTSPKKIADILYLANLELNFVNSRTIRIKNFKQAVRDYEHITNIAPEHVLAYWCLSKAYEGVARFKDARLAKKKAKKIAKTNKTQVGYLKHFNIKL